MPTATLTRWLTSFHFLRYAILHNVIKMRAQKSKQTELFFEGDRQRCLEEIDFIYSKLILKT